MAQLLTSNNNCTPANDWWLSCFDNDSDNNTKVTAVMILKMMIMGVVTLQTNDNHFQKHVFDCNIDNDNNNEKITTIAIKLPYQ